MEYSALFSAEKRVYLDIMRNREFFTLPADEDARSEAVRAMKPYMRGFAEDIYLGCDDWRQRVDGDLELMDAYEQSDHALAVNRFVWRRIKARVPSLPKLRVDTSLGLNVIKFRNSFLVRVKKLDHEKLARNLLTDQQRRIAMQDPLLFDDVPASARWLILGYRLQLPEIEVRDLWLTCQGFRQHLWEPYEIKVRPDEVGNVPMIGPAPKKPRPGVRVRVRTSDA